MSRSTKTDSRPSNQLRRFLAANKGMTPPKEGLSKQIKFVLCDVCDRLITFVVFRGTNSLRDVCNVCRIAVEQSPDKRIVTADGGTMQFGDNDPLYCLGKAPVTRGALRAAKLVSEVNEDEVRPTDDVLRRRLETQMTVKGKDGGTTNAPLKVMAQGKHKQEPPLEAKQHVLVVPPSAPKGRTVAAKQATTTRRGTNASAATAQSSKSKRARSPGPVTAEPAEDATPAKSRKVEPSPPPPPTPPAAARKAPPAKKAAAKRGGGSGRRTAPKRDASPPTAATAASDGEEAVPLRGSIPSRRPAATAATPSKKGKEADASADATGPAAMFDEDDMPFFLSQATLSAAASQPVVLPTVPTRPTAAAPIVPQPTAQAPPAIAAAPPISHQTDQTTTPSMDPTHKLSAAATASPQLPTARPSPHKADIDKANYLTMVSSGPVATLFGKITSLMSHKEQRPLLEQPSRLVVKDEANNAMSVEEGQARPWQNAFFGMSRRVTTAVFCPTTEAEGLWFSFACEGKEAASIEMWCAGSTMYGTVEVPVKKYTVSLGGGGVLGLSWVPCVLAKPDNDVLGVCTVLRQQLLLTCQLPRRNFPSEHIHVQIAGAQQIRVEGVSTMPVDVRWYTTHQSVAETYLLVTFECASVAVYQPLAETLNAKLSLVLLRTVVPPTRRASTTLDSMQHRSAAAHHLRIAPMAVGVAPSPAGGAGGGVYLAVGERDALCMMQAPSFELSSFSKLPMVDDDASPTGSRMDRVCAITATSKGFVVASEHALHLYSMTKSEHREMSTEACSAAPMVALRDVAPTLLVCANAAGQVVQARVRPSCLEARSVLWVQRQPAAAPSAAGSTPTSSSGGVGSNNSSTPFSSFVPPELHLRRTFDGCQRLPKEQHATVRYAFHPVVACGFSNYALAYFPDGAWVLFPSSWEKK